MTARHLTTAVAAVALLAACNGSDAAYVEEVRAGPHPASLTDAQISELGDVHCGQLHEHAATSTFDDPRDHAGIILTDLERSMVEFGATRAEARHMLAAAVTHLCPAYEYAL